MGGAGGVGGAGHPPAPPVGYLERESDGLIITGQYIGQSAAMNVLITPP